MPEKRKFMRFGVLLDAIFRGNTSGNAKINDFSRQGLGMITEEELREGENLEIEMNLPGDNIPIICQGEIAWTKKLDPERGKNKCGIEIKEIESKDRGRILEYIYKKWILSNEKKYNEPEVG